jgi:uncharacterized membrane protein
MDLANFAYKYLINCNIKVSQKFLEQRIKSHFNFPSLLSFTDTLDELGIEYSAVQGSESHISQFIFPFLAQTPKAPGGFEIITSKDYYQANKVAFLNRWEGVAIMIPPHQIIHHKIHNQFLKKENITSNVFLVVGCVIVLFFLLLNFIHFNQLQFVFSIFSILGTIICGLIVSHKLGTKNAITEQLCPATKSHSCDLVLNSKASQIAKGVEIGDAGLIYFLSLLLFSSFSLFAKNENNVLSSLFIPSILALGFTLFSLYYQSQVLKAWCKMCLMVIAVIWIQTLIPITYFLKTGFSFSNFTISPLIITQAILSFSIASSWLIIKSLLKNKASARQNFIKLLKWERNPDVFQSLLLKQARGKHFPSDNPIRIGNLNAPLQFTIVSNPFCRPCATAHTQLEELYQKYPEHISVTVIFSIRSADDKADRKNIAAESILKAIYSTENVVRVLHHWFKTMDLKHFNEVFDSNKEYEPVENTLKAYQQWVERNNITHTPFVFLNGHKLPKQYTLGSIETFVCELSERILQLSKNNEEYETIADFSR